MKRISITLLLFSLFSIMIFSELKEYNGTGKIILQKYGCPEAPESSTCGRYKFISETEEFIVDMSSWDLIGEKNIQRNDKVKISGYIQNEEDQEEASEPLLKIIKITKIIKILK